MRWALSQSFVPCFEGRVPEKPSRSNVEGTLLHALIEAFARHLLQEEVAGFRPRRTLLNLVAMWAADNAGNPRIDSRVLAGQLRIEEILRAFHAACSHVQIRPRRQGVSAASVADRSGVCDGAEHWLRDPQSKLCGRVDYISAGEIVDFKSGAQREHHVEQILFYGALYLALTGRIPNSLCLVYTLKNEIVTVDQPERI